MLRINRLTKSYKTKSRRHFVFKDVTVEFPEDVNIGILGPNGAGKSTLLRILGGIDYPDSGTVECDRSMSWPLGLRGGFISNLSGRENCKMICSLYGLRPSDIRFKLDFIKELSGIGDYFEEPVKYYSSGMGSRIGFALSMAFDFEILLIDEITAVGDRGFRDTAKQAIDDKRGKSNIIMVSHSMGSIRDFCDVGILLKDGELTIYERLDDAIRAYLPAEGTATKTREAVEAKVNTDSYDFTIKEDNETRTLRQQVAGYFRQIEQAIEDGDDIRDEGNFHHFLGTCYARVGDFARAYQQQQLAIDAQPDKISYHIQLTACSLQLGLLEQAEDCIQDAMKWWPKNASLHNQLASLRVRQARWHEAIKHHLEAVELAPDNPGIRSACAQSYMATGNYQEALRHIQVALDIDKTNHTFYKSLSRALAGLSRYDESLLANQEAEKKSDELEANHPSRTLGQLSHLRSQLERVAALLD